MSDYPQARGSGAAESHPRLRLAALVAVIAGVILVAAAAFLLSYSGIHQIALQAGISPRLARLYPDMFDAMLVIAGSATLALRYAGWPTRVYVWLSLLVLLGALAAGDAVTATSLRLPAQPTRAVVAIIPWALLLIGFGLWLAMLRHWRKWRAAAAGRLATDQHVPMAASTAAQPASWAAGEPGPGPDPVSWAASPGAAPARTGEPRTAIGDLLESRAVPAPGQAGTGGSSEADTGNEADTRSETDAESETADRASPASGTSPGSHAAPPVVPAPAPVPRFDRMHSGPTPPEETDTLDQ